MDFIVESPKDRLRTIGEALEAAHKGHKIARKAWDAKWAYLHFKGGKLVNQDGKPAVLGVSSMTADWVIWKEPKVTVQELIQKLKSIDNPYAAVVAYDKQGNRLRDIELHFEEEEKGKTLGALFG